MPRGKAKLTNSEREILETMWEYGESITATRACLKNKSCTKHIFPRPFS